MMVYLIVKFAMTSQGILCSGVTDLGGAREVVLLCI